MGSAVGRQQHQCCVPGLGVHRIAQPPHREFPWNDAGIGRHTRCANPCIGSTRHVGQATLGNLSGGTFTIGDLPMLEPGAQNWGMQNSFGRFYSNKAVVQGDSVVLVARIDFLAGNDRMRLWVLQCPLPFPLIPPLPPADIDVTNANVSTFTGVYWQTQGLGAELDELGVRVVQ